MTKAEAKDRIVAGINQAAVNILVENLADLQVQLEAAQAELAALKAPKAEVTAPAAEAPPQG